MAAYWYAPPAAMPTISGLAARIARAAVSISASVVGTERPSSEKTSVR